MGQSKSSTVLNKIEQDAINDFIHTAYIGDEVALENFLISGVPINTIGYLFSEHSYCHQEQYSAIMSSIKGGHVSLALFLLNRDGIHINYKTPTTGINAFMMACSDSTVSCTGLIDLLQLFINKGIPIDDKDIENGWTALCYAANSNNKMAAEFLIRNGADLNILDNFKQSVLHIACYKDNLEVVKILTESGIDIDLLDRDGNTAIDIAESDEVKDFLLSVEDKRSPGEVADPDP